MARKIPREVPNPRNLRHARKTEALALSPIAAGLRRISRSLGFSVMQAPIAAARKGEILHHVLPE